MIGGRAGLSCKAHAGRMATLASAAVGHLHGGAATRSGARPPPRSRIDPEISMRALHLPLLLLLTFTLTLTGCEAIAGIFEAGFWVGAVLMVVIFAIVLFVASRIRGSRGSGGAG
jgi:hypothetical protein